MVLLHVMGDVVDKKLTSDESLFFYLFFKFEPGLHAKMAAFNCSIWPVNM